MSFDDSGSDFDLPVQQAIFDTKLTTLRRRGYLVSNTFRSLKDNARVGGKGYSQHLLGLAGDLDIRGLSPEQINEMIRAARAQGLTVVTPEQEVALGHKPHVHVQAFRAGVVPKAVYRRQLGVQIQETP